MTDKETTQPTPGSTPESAIPITGPEIAKLRAGEEIGAIAALGTAERVYVTTNGTVGPQELIGSDGKPTGEIYDTWGVVAAGPDRGTRVDEMGRFAHFNDGIAGTSSVFDGSPVMPGDLSNLTPQFPTGGEHPPTAPVE